MLHITRRRGATSNTLQLRPDPQSYNNNKQCALGRGGRVGGRWVVGGGGVVYVAFFVFGDEC